MKQAIAKLLMAFVFVGLVASNALSDDLPAVQREINYVSDIVQASPETAVLFFEALTGDVYVSVGEGVTVFAVQGAPYLVANVNADTPLGFPDQADDFGIGWIRPDPEVDLPTGIFDLGNLLPANTTIRSGSEFDVLYPDALFRVGVVGLPELNPPIVIITGVPEPGSVGLLGVISCLVAARRQRSERTFALKSIW